MNSIKLVPLLLVLPALLAGGAMAADAARSNADEYEPNAEFPYGRPNPAAPAELSQFAFIVGANDCTEERLNQASGEWVAGERTWDAYYYINGYAIRDTGRSGNTSNGNIRIYDANLGQWKVHFFSMPVYGTGIWTGGMEGDEMILRLPQKAPGTDLDGFSTLTFSNISVDGFDWVGEWISGDGEIVFPFWSISCHKRSAP